MKKKKKNFTNLLIAVSYITHEMLPVCITMVSERTFLAMNFPVGAKALATTQFYPL